jgi:photosystem II stability/assembly factor-like uncharacterized protein
LPVFPAIDLRAARAAGAPGLVVGGHEGLVARTVDGVAWSYPAVVKDFKIFGMCHGWGATLATGLSGGLIRSTDAGKSWSPVSSGVTSSLYACAPSAAKTHLLVGTSGTILRSTTGGASWSKQTGAGNNTLRGVRCQGLTCLAAGYSGAILRSADGGLSWKAQVTGVSAILFGVEMGSTASAVAVGDKGLVIRSADGGKSWSKGITPLATTLYAVRAIDAQRYLAVGQTGEVIASADGGATWARHAPPTGQILSDLEIGASPRMIVGYDGIRLGYTIP